MFKETIATVLSALNRNNIPFLFFGMEALNVYLEKELGESFATKDADFLVAASLVKPGIVLDVLRKTNFPEEVHIVAKTPGRERPWILFDGLRWRNRKFPENVTISILTPPGPYSLDLAFGEPGIPFPDLWKRSKKAVCFGVTIRIAAKEDILTLKRLAGRPKDLLLLDRLRLTPRLKGRR